MTGEKRRIIDAHAHIFPSKIAKKAVQSIGEFYDLPMQHEGSSEALIESGAKIGTEYYLVCSTATRPDQVQSINDFIHGECEKHPEFVGFGTLHPDMEDIEGELDRIADYGLKGIKLHPDFQRFFIDEPKAVRLFSILNERKIPTLIHTGDDRYDFSHPRHLAALMERCEGLWCIAAHFGGYQRWKESRELLDFPTVFFDTSSTLFELKPETAVEMIRHFGAEKFFFGTDFPMWDHEEELQRFLALGLSEEENKKILFDNFAEKFGLK